MSTKSPSVDRAVAPDPGQTLRPRLPPPAGAASKLAIWIFLFLRPNPPQAAGW
jgi:hypothetical protein